MRIKVDGIMKTLDKSVERTEIILGYFISRIL